MLKLFGACIGFGLMIGVPLAVIIFLVGGAFKLIEKLKGPKEIPVAVVEPTEEEEKTKMTEALEKLGLTPEDLKTLEQCLEDYDQTIKECSIRNDKVKEDVLHQIFKARGLKYDENLKKFIRIRDDGWGVRR